MGQVIRPTDVRSRLREALELDLIGPGAGHPLADERLPGWVRPSNWYLTGFLVPRGAPAEQRADADADDDFEPEVADEGGLGDDSTEDRRSAKKGFFPSSLGLSFLVAEGVGRLDVTVRWGDYRYVGDASRDDGSTGDAPDGGEAPDSTNGSAGGAVVTSEGKATTRWQRVAREERVPVALAAAGDPYQEQVPDSRGLILHMVARPVSATTFAGRIPPGTRSASLFLVNGRPPAEDTARDEAFAFQAELEVRSAVPFVPRPDPRGASGDDSDERIADLHYADTPEYAAGHGVAADWELADGACRVLRTTWIPTAEVETTETVEAPDVELAMAVLGDLSDGGDAQRALTPLVTGYRTWIDQQDAALTGLAGERRDTAEELVFHARSAANRMERGIRVLSQDPDALDAFRVANRAVAAALSRRLAREGVTEPPRWRAFNPQGKPAPIPLESCPWCGKDFTPESFTLLPDSNHPTELRIACTDWECDFSGDAPLPIVAVDEPLYRRLPAFLVATVDKFASLPWVGESGALLGGADRHDESGFYGAAEPRRGNRLRRPLPPPDLIIQDELHLISGPLGTMAGLYEAAIEALCVRETAGGKVRPKIVASTATVRHAREQIQGLFGRPATHIFPPPGPSRDDSFFARTVPASERNARQYVGIAAQGRNPKEAMRRVLLTLMGAAERAWRDTGGPRNLKNPADPYLTVLGYFNSLRELGGARRILEEEVQNTLKRYGDRKRLGEAQGLFRDRTSFSDVVELTSRVSTDQVAEARRRLQTTFHDRKQRVDCAIATNMISVGLDIQRLGLMLVYGQPKTNSEYIQATSRVGRDDNRPGLVVMLYNVHRPRNRSHYERFRHYHETFYRSVEVASVTPFAARALDRGFPGALVTLARHAHQAMTPPAGVEAIEAERVELERLLLEVFRARVNEQPLQDDDERAERLRSVQNRIGDLLDSWRAILDDYRADAVTMHQKHEVRTRRPLLREMLDTDFESAHHRKFRVNRSLRDVEPQVNLFVQDLSSRLSGNGE